MDIIVLLQFHWLHRCFRQLSSSLQSTKTMNRRNALQSVALLLGGSIVGGSLFLQSGCQSAPKKVNALFDENQVKLMDEIAETILPKTDTPGAKDAAVGAFMALMVLDCYTPEHQQVFLQGLKDIEERSKKSFSNNFLSITPEQRTTLLTTLDKEQKAFLQNKEKEAPPHYFRMLKELTLLGFFTSKVGATQALRYKAIPGKYEGCIDYKKGDKAWAT